MIRILTDAHEERAHRRKIHDRRRRQNRMDVQMRRHAGEGRRYEGARAERPDLAIGSVRDRVSVAITRLVDAERAYT